MLLLYENGTETGPQPRAISTRSDLGRLRYELVGQVEEKSDNV